MTQEVFAHYSVGALVDVCGCDVIITGDPANHDDAAWAGHMAKYSCNKGIFAYRHSEQGKHNAVLLANKQKALQHMAPFGMISSHWGGCVTL